MTSTQRSQRSADSRTHPKEPKTTQLDSNDSNCTRTIGTSPSYHHGNLFLAQLHPKHTLSEERSLSLNMVRKILKICDKSTILWHFELAQPKKSYHRPFDLHAPVPRASCGLGTNVATCYVRHKLKYHYSRYKHSSSGLAPDAGQEPNASIKLCCWRHMLECTSWLAVVIHCNTHTRLLYSRCKLHKKQIRNTHTPTP